MGNHWFGGLVDFTTDMYPKKSISGLPARISNCADWATVVSCHSYYIVNQMWHFCKTATPQILAYYVPVLWDRPVGGQLQYNILISQVYPRALRPTLAYHYTLELVRVLRIKIILLWYIPVSW